jgi:hypothetical protein
MPHPRVDRLEGGRQSGTAVGDDQQQLLALGIDHQYRSKKIAYHEYCSLLQDLSEQLYKTRKPYFAEMLLFLAAPTVIIEDIKRSVTVTIAGAPRSP